MEDEIKIANCGCGGKAVHGKWVRKVGVIAHAVGCKNCGIQTKPYPTEAEAIQAWNRAMSANVQECAKDARCSERTAKVEDIKVEWGDDEYVNDKMGAMYHYGDCGNCGETVSHNQKYCHECGARLEWE